MIISGVITILDVKTIHLHRSVKLAGFLTANITIMVQSIRSLTTKTSCYIPALNIVTYSASIFQNGITSGLVAEVGNAKAQAPWANN